MTICFDLGAQFIGPVIAMEGLNHFLHATLSTEEQFLSRVCKLDGFAMVPSRKIKQELTSQ